MSQHTCRQLGRGRRRQRTFKQSLCVLRIARAASMCLRGSVGCLKVQFFVWCGGESLCLQRRGSRSRRSPALSAARDWCGIAAGVCECGGLSR